MKRLIASLFTVLFTASVAMAANQDLSQKTEATSMTNDDLIYVLDDPSGAKNDRKISYKNFFSSLPCSFIVASDTATDKESADYVCSGNCDDEFQAAENACPSGGCKVCFAGDDILFGGALTVDQIPFALVGQAASNGISKIKMANGVNLPALIDVNVATDKQGLLLANFHCDGNDATNTTSRCLRTGVGAAEAQDVILEKLWVMNHASTPALDIEDAWGAIVDGLICEFNNGDCLKFTTGQDFRVFGSKIITNDGAAIVTGNATSKGQILGNRLAGGPGRSGVELDGDNHIVLSNHLIDTDGSDVGIEVLGNTMQVAYNNIVGTTNFDYGVLMDAGSNSNKIGPNHINTVNTSRIGKAGTNNNYYGDYGATVGDYLIDPKGNVGIEQDAPASKLHVGGNIQADGKYIALNAEEIRNDVDGQIQLLGLGQTNNENFYMDFETQNNRVIFKCNSGCDFLFDSNIRFNDNLYFVFGTGTDAGIRFDTGGAIDVMQYGTRVGSTNGSGHHLFMEYGDLGAAGRVPTANWPGGQTPTNPVLAVASADAATGPDDVCGNWHDGTDGRFDCGTGDYKIGTNVEVTGTLTTVGAGTSSIPELDVTTVFNLPDDANPTVDAQGECAWDSTADQIVCYDGAAVKVFAMGHPPPIHKTLESPADADAFLLQKAQEDMTITDIHCIVDPADTAESVVIDIQECNGTADSCSTVDATITCDNDGAEDDGTLTNPSIDAGDWINWDIGTVTGTVTQVAVTVYWERTRK